MTSTGVWYDWPLILAYHSISDRRSDGLAVRVDDFDGQLGWLRRHGFRSMTLADYIAERPEKGSRIVIVTFDDGYADNFTNAFPLLRKHGFVATAFVVSDVVGTDHVFGWDVPKLDPSIGPAPYQALQWDQVEEMASSGVEIGSHTCTHPELTGVTVEQCRDEVTRSRLDIERRLGRGVVSFCYPRGMLDDNVVRAVETAGYQAAVVTPKRSGIPLSPFTLRRVGVYNNITPLRFRAKITPLVRRHLERSMPAVATAAG
ncbi:MAG TPA: polysaccharide deacetylase family protein [Actinomycetes bacterium]